MTSTFEHPHEYCQTLKDAESGMLLDEEVDSKRQSLHRKYQEHNHYGRLCWISVLSLFFGAILLSTGWFMIWQRGNNSVTHWSDCGTTAAEARSRGCRFDILSFAWQTPECFDEELMDSFANQKPWNFFEEYNNTLKTVPYHVAVLGEQNLYVDWDFHIWHCTYMYRQMHRAFARGYIDSHLDDYHHTLHCQKTLLERQIPMDAAIVEAFPKFPSCRSLGQSSSFKNGQSPYG